MEPKKGKLIIFSAPSGSGKTTIVKHLLSLDLGLEFSISATSRAPRKGEQEGKDYYFLSPEIFLKKVGQGAFLEWEEVYDGQYYGTLLTEVERIRNVGKHVLFDIDVEGGLNIKKKFGNDALAVFVSPPSLEVLEERLRKRGTDSEEQLLKRVRKAKKEMEYASRFDYRLINDNLDNALAEAEKIISAFIRGRE